MKVYIADILRKAADEFLWDGDKVSVSDVNESSCNAVWACLKMSFQPWQAGLLDFLIGQGLYNMGLSTGSDCEFEEFSSHEERQAARYNWLYFAALMAEEQGAFVEISD